MKSVGTRAHVNGCRCLERLATPLLVLIIFCLHYPSEAFAVPKESVDHHLQVPVEPRGMVIEGWGVEVLGIRQTASGYMLDFRYKVLDAEKAAPLFVRKIKPCLVDERTGAELIVPAPGKVGPLRSSNAPKEGRTYWMIFANPGRFIKLGSRVTIAIGDFRVQGLVVE